MAVIGFFADGVVLAVESRHYPQAAARARDLPLVEQFTTSLQATLRALLTNLVALPFALALLLTGVGTALLFLAVNAMLIGRELQDMVWLRHRGAAGDPSPLARSERWMLGDVKFVGLFSAPPSITSVVGQVDIKGAFNIGMAGVIFSFMLVNLFDSSGTLIGVTDKAGLTDETGTFPRMQQALYVDSISSVSGALAGTSSVTAYIESTSGVAIGGRTGLMAVVTGLPRADRWREVRVAQVEQLLERARTHGEVVVDTGFSLEDDTGSDVGGRPGRNALTLTALEQADEVVVVGAADPVGLTRLARGLVDLRDRAPGTPVRVAVNRMRPSIGWSEKEIAGMVEGFSRVAGLHFLPDDRAGLDQALVSGRPVADLGASPLVHALAALADAVFPAHARGGVDGPSVRTRLRRGRGSTGHGGGRRSTRSG